MAAGASAGCRGRGQAAHQRTADLVDPVICPVDLAVCPADLEAPVAERPARE